VCDRLTGQADLEKARLPVLRFHDLRHTAASLLLHEKVRPRVVMDLPGHSEFRRRWTSSHVAPILRREAAEQMDLVLDAAQARTK
jgi:integrase